MERFTLKCVCHGVTDRTRADGLVSSVSSVSGALPLLSNVGALVVLGHNEEVAVSEPRLAVEHLRRGDVLCLSVRLRGSRLPATLALAPR